ncbi:hypothetical protein EAS56_35390 [Bradyrhizobium guangzhouense]|uniref:Uncharacterized protein n=1 Tax=Bradyrhizobium guangzhouense TaxID=1325095 RepID=A0AAE6CBV6_9BRAD|nr:DUF5985 family protein [Bradyrhizobium guangzhouense]QAU50201.1 hypothetical protein XH91_17680 [Bradyrhizobium guangzhouense]RXH05684.1 hypothetical protein EAS56_35390 [Bradyrhizobium guangzhouense]
MSSFIYGLCAATSAVCAGMLLGAYRRNKYRLLLWSGLCFVGLALNNVILVLDKVILPDVDLSSLRLLVALIAMTVLLYGLIWDVE